MKAIAAAAAAAACLLAASVSRRFFGKKKVTYPVYVLKNHLGMEVHVTTLGATIQRVLVPGMDGKLDDVVLGFDDVNTYTSASNPYFGGIVGRCANRIAHGRFKLDDVEYKLATNNGPNHLHGGRSGLNKRVWEATLQEEATYTSLRLTYISRHMEEGYPGTLCIPLVKCTIFPYQRAAGTSRPYFGL